MANIIPIPDHTSVGSPYTEVRANADNLNGPWRREYLDKQVKYGDMLNAMLGTLNSNTVRVRDDNTVLTANTSRVHATALDDGIRNATDVGGTGIHEISTTGWKTPVFSRAVCEFATPTQINNQIQNAINGLADIDGEVELAIIAWQDPQGPSVIKPAVDNWNDVSSVVNFTNFLQGQFGVATPPTRSVAGIGLTRSRRNFLGTSTVFQQTGAPSDVVITSSVSRQLMSYRLLASDAISSNIVSINIFFENTGFLVYDDIQVAFGTTTGTGTNVCPVVVIRVRPSIAGVPQEGEGGFQVRLYNVVFKQLADIQYFQLGSVIGSQNGINWFPRGS